MMKKEVFLNRHFQCEVSHPQTFYVPRRSAVEFTYDDHFAWWFSVDGIVQRLSDTLKSIA